MIARTTSIAAGLSLSLAGVALAEDRSYDLTGFSHVEVNSGITLILTTGRDFSVSAESPRSGGLRRLELDVDDDTLIISRKSPWSGISFLRGQPKITVTVSVPQLDGLAAASGASADVTAGQADHFEAQTSSGAFAKITGLSAGEVDLQASSGSDLRVDGTCSAVIARASSGATLQAGDLKCEAAEADASSGANLAVWATGDAEAEASSGASVRVGGGPVSRDERESSGGSVVFR